MSCYVLYVGAGDLDSGSYPGATRAFLIELPPHAEFLLLISIDFNWTKQVCVHFVTMKLYTKMCDLFPRQFLERIFR